MSEHFSERGFIENPDAELFRFVEFAARFGACEDVIRFLAYAAGDMPTERFDLFGGFFARH